jgi:hypothetical protein
MTVVPHPPCFSPLPQLKIRMKGRHFDTTDVIKAKSRMLVKKKGSSPENGAYTQNETTSSLTVGNMAKVNFDRKLWIALYYPCYFGIESILLSTGWARLN